MKTLIKIFSNYFENFRYFYHHIGYKVLISVGLSILVGILDGFGLSMFLPLLQMVNESSAVDPKSLGNLRFVVDYMQVLGISINLLSVLVFLCIFFGLKGLAQYIRNIYQVNLQQFFIKKIRLDLISSLSEISYKSFVLSDVGRIQNTFSGEVDRVARAYQTYFTAIQNMVLVLVYMGFAFFVDARFAILVSLGGAMTNFLYKQIYKNTKGASKQLTAESHVFQSLIIQHIANFKYLKATSYLKIFSRKLSDSVVKIEESNKKIGVLSSILTSSREPLLIFVVCIVIYLQIKVLGAPLGPILISLLFFYRSLGSLMIMQTQWNLFLAVSGSLTNMTEFGNELERNREIEGYTKLDRLNTGIQLKDVFFGYQDKMILKNINLDIKRNETIAFVGESGSGKTTLVNILAGLIPQNSGEVVIDGINREDLNLESFQRRIGYITQDPVIFNDSIFNNVTFWEKQSPSISDRFNEAVSKASLNKFIDELPQKEETILGNNGVNLSGGQKQRISIARELYKEIDLLILDEATSALDSETEQSIQKNIDSLKGKYTLLIVAHRLSTIRNADRIVFMKDGEIAMIDNFESLYNKSDDFNRMVKLQELK